MFTGTCKPNPEDILVKINIQDSHIEVRFLDRAVHNSVRQQA